MNDVTRIRLWHRKPNSGIVDMKQPEPRLYTPRFRAWRERRIARLRRVVARMTGTFIGETR